MSAYKVGYIIGSLAKASINRKLAKALVRLAPPELEMTEIPFKDLPLYSYDYDADFPPVARAFKKAIADVDAVLFVTPEYNRSIPGRTEERHRLGQPPLRQELVRAQALGRDRDFAGCDRHRGRAAAPAQPAQLLQLAADERPRSLHPVQPGLINDDGKVTVAVDRRVPAQLHGGVPRLRREGPHGAA